MNETGFDTLARIIEPCAPEEFLGSVWGANFLHIRGTTGRFADLMPWERVNEVLQRHRLDFPRLRLVLDGKPLPMTSYLRHTSSGRLKSTVPRLLQVNLIKELRDGATLVLDAVDELQPPIETLARGLELFFHEHVQVNMYAGWQTSPGFDLHWDDHDVFILQVTGRKRWNVYGTTRQHPLVHDIEAAARPDGPPLWEAILEDGDLLYIPRGWWHVAVPLAEPTLHLTVGIHNRTGLDLLKWLTDEMRSSETFRQDLPRFAHASARQAHFARLRREFFEAWDATVEKRFYQSLDAAADARTELGLPWIAIPDASPPDDFSLVRLLAPRRMDLKINDGVVEIVALKRRWRFALGALPILRALATRRVCTIAELREEAADLDEKTVRTFVSELAAKGLISVSRR